MKKILSVLLLAILMIPMVVKADAYQPEFGYNSNIVVGGELQFTLGLYSPYYGLDKTTIEYDTSLLEIDKSRIEIEACGTDLIDSDDLHLTIENGLITIYSETALLDGCLFGTYEHMATATLHFNTIKSGTAKIKLNNDHYMCGGVDCDEEFLTPKVVIKDPDCSSLITEPKDLENNCSNCPETEECNCPKQDCDCPVVPEKENDNNCNLWLYCSLGLNALLLIVLIIVAATRKKKTVVIEEQPKEVIEETKEEKKEE